ncbi:MAG TPA: acetate--CoA ligase [Thermoanaerobaculia bacterium]|jgi:acetyl-CoA synthetase|nr:acetate--CoA ligase [Thermoanaerobaculia bacterium]
MSATDLTEAQIAVHWKEEGYVYPSPSFIAQANLTDASIDQRFSLHNFPGCFDEYAELLTWYRKWDKTLDSSNPPFWKWYAGGVLNASYNCIDRHLPHSAGKAAFIFVPELEDEETVTVTYQELYNRVNEVAAVLRDFCGLRSGDRVTIHMPLVPELPITMLACARLGVVHSVVFGGFSGAACGQRIADSGSRVLISMDGYYRSGQVVDHKEKVDLAVDAAKLEGQEVAKVLVWRRHKARYLSATPMVDGRDVFMDEILQGFTGRKVDPVHMPSEAPLFLMYTSGTTARPKGCQHSTGGYLAYVTATAKSILDIHADDIYWCMADIGWITGHSYIVYGPLALGTTGVLYEGVPTYPDPGRPWRIAQRLGVNIFHTAPTAIRMLRKVGPSEPLKYDYHFKLMVTVGEPIEPEVWRWYYDVVGKKEAVIVDTWWQTETGGFLCSTKPALQGMKAGSAGPGLPGIYPVIYDEGRQELPPGHAGNICIRNPWPGVFQTIWRDPDRFVKTYYEKYCADPKSKDWRDWPYLAGDGAVCAEDGYIRILGRVDDVINVAGHRLGTKELESACLVVTDVAEAAVVPVVDEARGRVPDVYIALKPGIVPSRAIELAVVKELETLIGKIARPKHVRIVPDMPKTRSGKIMRRVLAAISNNMPVGDVTTLANPEIVEQIRVMVQGNEPVEVVTEVADDIRNFGQES